jgi:hypothetical protein
MPYPTHLLEAAGCSQADIVDAALTLFIPWQRTRDEQYQVVSDRIAKACMDPTVNTLMHAACLLGGILDDANISYCNTSSDSKTADITDMSGPYLGMIIAQHLAGSYAYFEYTRYVKHSPGILGRLKNPHLTHSIAGLIAGVTSRLYSEGW